MAARKSTRRDPRWHAARIRDMLQEAAQHCRKDVHEVRDRRAKVLFETTAEVLDGLTTEFDHYEEGRIGVPFLNRFIDSMERLVETIRPPGRRGRPRSKAARAAGSPRDAGAAELAGASVRVAHGLWRARRRKR